MRQYFFCIRRHAARVCHDPKKSRPRQTGGGFFWFCEREAAHAPYCAESVKGIVISIVGFFGP